MSVGVAGIRLRARVGVTEPERATERELVVDVELVPATTRGLVSDELADTVDYARIVELVTEVVTVGEHRLIERIAALAADRLMAELDPREVSEIVRKPAPPVAAPAAEAWARVTRRA